MDFSSPTLSRDNSDEVGIIRTYDRNTSDIIKGKLKLNPMFQEYVDTFWKKHNISSNVTGLLYLCVNLINNRPDTTLRFFFGPVYM